jgi:ribosome-binding factor A
VIQEVLAEEVERLTDPRLGLVSVTGVEVSPDMRHAVVFVSALDPAQIGDALTGLRAAAPRLRAILGRQIRTKFTPDLEFRADSGVLDGERIDAILRRIQSEEDDAGND